ncbi:FMN-binding protein [Actinopolymorpha pittospori]
MKRVVITVVSTIAGLGVLLGLRTQTGTGRAPSFAEGGASNTQPDSSTGPQVRAPSPSVDGRATSGSTKASPAAASSSSANSSRTPDVQATRPAGRTPATRRKLAGQTVMTAYGPVQVQVTMVDSKITDISTLQLPNGNQRDLDIASYAVPELRSEALAAQSAQINAVSGATYTSEGYVESLQSALDRARV